ncbi:MAG: cytochrome c3 family protein [Nitrospirota bacterium]
MKLRKIDGLFVLFAVAVVVGVSILPTPKDRNPMIPADAAHQPIKAEQACLQCHVPTGSQPMLERHPRRQDCFRCHARAA